MKRIASVILLICAVGSPASARRPAPPGEVTEKQWHDVLVAVSNEEWDTAFDLSSKYLKQLKVDDERMPRLRYIYLYDAAGRVSEGGMSYDELERAVKGFEGKEVVLPYRPIGGDCRGDLNFICASEGSKDRLIVAATNKAGTTIHSFEYVQLKEKFDAASHEGEEASIGGVIDAIKLNPNKSKVLIMRIYITGGVVKLKEQLRKKASIKYVEPITGRLEEAKGFKLSDVNRARDSR